MERELISKTELASRLGVSQGRVSQYIAAEMISGDAIVGEGRHAHIDADLAMRQLRRTLDADQSSRSNFRAKVSEAKVTAAKVTEPVECIDEFSAEDTGELIKLARLRQIELSNRKADAEDKARDGIYIRADDARREMGRAISTLLSTFDAAIGDMAETIIKTPPASTHAAGVALRGVWASVRAKEAAREKAAAQRLPMHESEGADGAAL